MLVLIYAGMHVAITLGLLSFVGVWLIRGDPGVAANLLAQAVSDAIASHIFGVVPLFVLTGFLVAHADAVSYTHLITVMAQRHCQPRGHEEDVDQWALELLREGAPQRLGWHFGQRVQTVVCLGALHGADAEALLRVDPEVAQQALRRHGVPDWNDLSSPLVRHSADPSHEHEPKPTGPGATPRAFP